MPLSVTGFGPAAIIIMLLCLVGKQTYEFLKAKYSRRKYP